MGRPGAGPDESPAFVHPIAASAAEIFECTEAVQGIRDDVRDGRSWLPAMHQTLERLAALAEPG
jgi:hypothetical protein